VKTISEKYATALEKVEKVESLPAGPTWCFGSRSNCQPIDGYTLKPVSIETLHEYFVLLPNVHYYWIDDLGEVDNQRRFFISFMRNQNLPECIPKQCIPCMRTGPNISFDGVVLLPVDTVSLESRCRAHHSKYNDIYMSVEHAASSELDWCIQNYFD
jgi:hypothetical protein